MGRHTRSATLGGLACRRSHALVLWFAKIEDWELRFVLIFDIGIRIIVPASIEAPNLSLYLKDSSDITARVLETSCWSAIAIETHPR